MSRNTIDFGIDLGTTNCAIALLNGVDQEVIKNTADDRDITPSAIYINKHGQIYVGDRAKNRLTDEKSANDVHIEFKRRMGSDQQYPFKSSGQIMSPEQLSAEMLKSLRGDVQLRKNELINTAVITVPAAFEQKQCASTRDAGEIAGLYKCPLVQEPVAAALAYGYQSEVTKAYWLIYDFGGGTFDSAIMKAEDGTINVVNHGGDNYLGGSDIDWAIVEKLIVPTIQNEFNLPNFSRGNRKWKTALAKIKRSVEIAKINLSTRESTYLEDCCFTDADGEEVEFEFNLTRNAVVSVADPLIVRSVDICKRVLKEKNLGPSAIEKVVLVGGPTKAPYFREILEDNLGIPLDFSVDPLTVVARGAAVFAGTQRFQGKSAPKAQLGQYQLDLNYDPVGADEDFDLRGKVKFDDNQMVDGMTVEFVNQQTLARSGKIPIKKQGAFKVTLQAEKGKKNDFSIELVDSSGAKLECVPDTITYRVGMSISEQPVIHNISVALANNRTDLFIRKGDPLPAKARRGYKTSHMVKKGAEDLVLKIPVVEGDVEMADRNPLLGSLVINGTQIRRDIPPGSEVDVSIIMDESRMMKVQAYIPVLDEEYEVTIDYEKKSPDAKRLREDYTAEVRRLTSLQNKVGEAQDEDATSKLEMLEERELMDDIERLVESAEGDSVAADQAERRLLELKVELDRAEQSLEWPALVAEANKTLDELDEIVDAHAPQERAKADALRADIEDLIEDKRAAAMKKKLEKVLRLHSEILFEQPGFWMGFFQHLANEKESMNDQVMADQLMAQGQQFIQQGNVDGLRRVVAQLLGLLPEQAAEAIQRGYQSGLVK